MGILLRHEEGTQAGRGLLHGIMVCMAGMADHEIERVLGVFAHPDDGEFWLGGTVAQWAAAGIEVTFGILTDGERGGFDPELPRAEIPDLRRAEQRAAAQLLGVERVEFLGFAEGQLERGWPEIHVPLVRLIRQVRPQRVVTWSPEWNWQRFRSCHPDHLAAGAHVLRAIYPDAGNPFALTSLAEEGLEPWTVAEVWLINSPEREVNHYVDITGTFDRKVAAVRAHASQVGNRSDLAGELRQRIAPNRQAAGLPEGRLAEAFQVVITG